MRSLIVEDDILSRELLVSILSEYGECDIARNGEEALENVRLSLNAGKPYDLMCLDILMPVLDGMQALLEIRKLERSKGIKEHKFLKVIMVTAMEDFDNIMNAFEDGHCEAYLAKPIQRQELLEHLQDLELIEKLPNTVRPSREP